MDASILTAVAVCLLVIILIQRLRPKGKLPPGPIGLPIVGYIPFLSRKPYLDLQKLAKTYGNIFSIRLGSVYVVVLNDFESTKDAFNQDAFMGRPPDSPFNLNKETIETGAFNEMPWREQRRFSLHMLRDLGFGKSKMEGHIQEEINELLEHVEQHADKPFCIYELLAPSMSNNIGSLVYGKRFKYDDPVRQMLTRVLKESGAAAGQAAWQLFFPRVKKICRYFGIGDIDRIDRILKESRDFTMSQIEEHEKTLDPSNIRDFIDGYLLEIQKRKEPAFCKPVLQDLVGGFFGAGSETVRLSVEWLMLTAAVHQDKQRRVHQEIDETIGKSQIVTYTDHKLMPYTNAFIMELMRWKTIVPIVPLRYTLADTELKGYFIPKNTTVLSNLWAIQHNPDYWGKDAELFKPDRFLTDDGQEVKKWEQFVPFSIGKRECPGKPLAKIEVFLYFVSILQKFHVKVPDGKVIDFEGDLGIGLMPKTQELIFTKRN